MIVHPAIAALRADPGSQRSNQKAMEAAARDWLSLEEVKSLQRDLVAFDEGAALDDCPTLSRLIGEQGVAAEFAECWCTRMLAALSRSPLGEVPFPHRHSGGYSTVRLLSQGTATLSLAAYERRDVVVQPETAIFVDRESIELVIAGEARGVVHRLHQGAGISSIKREWVASDCIITSARETRQFAQVSGSMLVLNLTRSPKRPAPTREYRLHDCRLLKSASGDKASSRDMLALAVLGAIGHLPASGAMERIAEDSAREPDLRWEAVRQLLAIDAARGFAVLTGLAGRGGDALAAPAAKLRRQLLATYPQFAGTEAA